MFLIDLFIFRYAATLLLRVRVKRKVILLSLQALTPHESQITPVLDLSDSETAEIRGLCRQASDVLAKMGQRRPLT